MKRGSLFGERNLNILTPGPAPGLVCSSHSIIVQVIYGPQMCSPSVHVFPHLVSRLANPDRTFDFSGWTRRVILGDGLVDKLVYGP